MKPAALFALGLCAALTTSCGDGGEGDMVRVAIMGVEGPIATSGVRLSSAAAHVRAATSEGLVTFDENGDVVPALAERWIVTDNAQSYIFRLRNSEWPDGQRLSSENVRDALLRLIAQLDGTSLGQDLAIIDDVRAMAGRVIEVRLKSPMPQFLNLLAQPELGLRRGKEGTGPMQSRTVKKGTRVTSVLHVLAPEKRGLPQAPNWEDGVRSVEVWSTGGPAAVESFYSGEADVVLNGRLASLPLADTGPLSRGTMRLDPAVGLLGLVARNEKGLLSEPGLREAISMAIDREEVANALSLGGWLGETRLVPDVLLPQGTQMPRWNGMAIEQRRAQAASRIAAWRGGSESVQASLSVYLPDGPGSDRLFNRLKSDLASIGVNLMRAKAQNDADLELIDRVARYASPRWFLNQVHCSHRRGPCSPDADALVAQALTAEDAGERDRLLQKAADIADESNVFIPLGAPIRWSLIRGGLTGFANNSVGLHPLFPMALRPN